MSAPSNSSIYRVERIEVDPARACLRRDGREIHIKPKPFRVLLHLLEQRDRLVTKEELLDLFWKDTAVTDDALIQCIADVRRALGDSSRNPTYLKTVPRIGYRFVGPVEDIRPEAVVAQEPLATALPDLPPAHELKPSVSRRRIGWLVLGALAAGSLAASALWTGSLRGPLPSTGGKRQIVLFRFENRSGQSDLDWLREGLPDMLATTLSRSRALEILSPGQLYWRADRSAKTDADAVIKLARSAHADAAVIGTFSKLGNSMRVDARIYDAHRGSLLAAEYLTVDRPDQILTQVDQLAARLAAHIAPPARELDRRVLASLMTENLEAYRYYSLGLEKAEAMQTGEAIALFEKALALDPQFAMAYARIGYAYAVTDVSLTKGRPYLEKAFRMSAKLTEKDRRHIVAWYAIANRDYRDAIRRYSELIAEYPNEVEAYFRLAALCRGESRHEEAIELLRHANAIDPEDPKIYNAMSAVSSEMGRHPDAIAMADRYIALAPSDPNAYDSLGLSYQSAGDFDRALEAFGKALELKPDFAIASFHRAMLYAQMGREQDAIRESLLHTEPGASELERSRGLGQAAYVYWRRGRNAEARSVAALELKLHVEGVRPWVPAFLLVSATGLGKAEAATPRTGRGAKFGQRTTYFLMAQEARLRGRAEEMLGNLRHMLALKTGWGEPEPFEDALGDAYFQLGRTDEAIGEYERALRLFPGMARARYHLAQAYVQKGRHDAAKEQFRQFLNIWKHADHDLPELAQAERRTS